jgi:hypothetical protein
MARELQHVSVMTLAEIQKGIELLDEGKRRARLEQWLTQDLETWFSGAFFMLTVRYRAAGHRSWRKECG